MKTHYIKIKQKYFDRIMDGSKTFEVRKNDRDYQNDDQVVFAVVPDEDRQSPPKKGTVK